MNKEQKGTAISELKDKFQKSTYFYLADTSSLTVEQVNKLRRMCFEKNVEIKIVKNTLARKAMDQSSEDRGYKELYEALHGPTAVMFSDNPNIPAKIIKEFRASAEKPTLKAAFIDTAVFLGDDQLDSLVALKSKNELVADIIALLQSPAKNVISALQSSGHKLSGLLKTLEDRGGNN
jgi:large subunit ribosomal protein L10